MLKKLAGRRTMNYAKGLAFSELRKTSRARRKVASVDGWEMEAIPPQSLISTSC